MSRRSPRAVNYKGKGEHVEGALVVLKNGTRAQVQANNRLKFVPYKGKLTQTQLNERAANLANRRPRGSAPLVPAGVDGLRSARILHTKYFNKKGLTDKGLKAAKTRDMCHKAKVVTDTKRYKSNPQKFDYPGFDDGSLCEEGKEVREYSPRTYTAEQRALMVKNLEAARKKKRTLKNVKKAVRRMRKEE